MPDARRQRLRDLLKGPAVVHPASVFDPVSARIAQSLGYETAMLAGSVASASVLGAPDVMVLTATELAGLCRRIARAADIPLIVDADHGFGNALNVMRTVEELEAAGVAALTIEDTALPEGYGRDAPALTGTDEMVARLRAALAARTDPGLVIVGRTGALRHGGSAEAVRRAKAYEAAGVDAIFIAGARTLQEIAEVRRSVALPVLLGMTPAGLADDAWLAEADIRISFQGHTPFHAAMQAAHDALRRLRDGAAPEEIAGAEAGGRLLEDVLPTEAYARWRKAFLDKDFLGKDFQEKG